MPGPANLARQHLSEAPLPIYPAQQFAPGIWLELGLHVRTLNTWPDFSNTHELISVPAPASAVALEDSLALNFWDALSGHKLGFAANG